MNRYLYSLAFLILLVFAFAKEGVCAESISYPLNATPQTTDQLIGIDDPSGTWAINRFKLADLPISDATASGLATKEPLKGTDDNYITDAEKVTIGNTTGTNTGDQVGDGATITGAGTPGDPFVAVSGSGAVDSVNGQTGVVVLDKADIGLGSVDNTSDSTKPVSGPQQTALDGKADKSDPINTETVTGATLVIDLAGKNKTDNTVTIDQNTTITFSNFGVIGTRYYASLRTQQPTGDFTVTVGGVSVALTANGNDMIVVYTDDGGTTTNAVIAQNDIN